MSADLDDGLAVQRTALAWQRTGLSHMALGAVTLRLLPTSPFRPALGAALVVVGAVISIGSRRLRPDRPHRRWVAAVAAATAAAAGVAAVLSFA